VDCSPDHSDSYTVTDMSKQDDDDYDDDDDDDTSNVVERSDK